MARKKRNQRTKKAPQPRQELPPKPAQFGDIHDQKWRQTHMVTVEEAFHCSHNSLISGLDWLVKLLLVWRKLGHGFPAAAAGAVVLDLIIKVFFKYVSSYSTEECLRKSAYNHINRDIRRVRNGCRHRVRGIKLTPPILVPGGGEFGGGGAGSSWGDSERILDPYTNEELPEFSVFPPSLPTIKQNYESIPSSVPTTSR